MSKSIDQRIVEMQFNNRQFETGIKDSLGSLDKLKKGLNLDSAKRGLTDLSTAASRFSLSGLGSAVDTVANRFSSLGVIGVTALVNIANQAINAGKQLLNSLTLAPISKGFAEYESGLSAFQTIFANTQSQTAKVSEKQVSAINKTAAAATKAAMNVSSSGSSGVSRSQTLQVRAYQKAAAEELDILANKQEKTAEALDKAIKKESDTLASAHKDKLKLYDDEYMAKLKSIDEERYNKIKVIDNEISLIEGVTKAEEDALRITEEQQKLKNLQAKVTSATTVDARLEAEKEVADYQAELARDQVLLDRQIQINNLEANKVTITAEYDLILSNLEIEYNAKVEKENNLFDLTSENLRTQQDEKLKALRATQKIEKDLLNERQSAERDAQSDRQAASSGGAKKNQTQILADIEARRQAEIKALQDAANAIKMPSSIQDIDDALLSLNDYANKTIYSFGDMTKAMGLFTAQGVNLDDSLTGIKGIFNIVSLTGGTAEKANSLIYQLSQAIAGGTVRAQDWISVVNAGVGGIDFQNQLKQTARNHGVAVDEMISKNGTFKASLEEGWLSSSILLETLQQYTGDMSKEQLATMGYTEEQVKQIIKLGATANESATKLKSWTQVLDTLTSNVVSGWAASFKLIIGNLDEATVLWTGFGNAISGILQSFSDARNAMLKMWKDVGGRQVLMDTFVKGFEALKLILKPIMEAFREFFPPTTGKDLYKITLALWNFTKSLKIGAETSEKVKRIFRGVFAVLDIGKQIFVTIAKGIGILLKAFKPARDVFVSVAAAIGDWLVALDNSAKTGDTFNKFLTKFSDAVSWIATFISGAAKGIKDGIATITQYFDSIRGIDLSGVESFVERFKIRFAPLIALGTIIGEAFKWLFETIKTGIQNFSVGFDQLKAIGEGIGTAINWIGEKLGEGGTKTADVLGKMKAAFSTFGDGVAKIFGGIGDWFGKLFANFSFENFTKAVDTGLFAGLAIVIGKFIGSFTKIAGNAAGILKSISGVIDGVRGCLTAFQTQIKAGTLTKIAISIGILAASLIVLSMIDPKKLLIATGAITVLFADLAVSMSLFSKSVGTSGTKGLMTASLAMIAMSTSVLMLAGALSSISSIPEKDIARGLLTFTAVLSELLAFMKVAESLKSKGSLALISMGTSMLIFANALKKFSALDEATLLKGLGVLTALLTLLAGFIFATKTSGNALSIGVGMIFLATGILIFGNAIEKMGKLPLDVIRNGLTAIGGALGIITVALTLMPADMLVKSIGLLAISAALLVLGAALKNMGGMTPDQAKTSIVMLAGALGIIVLAMMGMTNALPGAAALLVISFALTILAGVLLLLGTMSLAAIGIALLAIAGTFLILGVAALVLAPLIPVLLGLALAIGLLGVAALAIGVGLLFFSTGLATLAVSGGAGAAVLVLAVKSILELIPFAMEMLGKGIVAFAKVLSDSYPTLFKAMETVLLSLISAIDTVAPKAIHSLMMLLKAFLRELADNVPDMVDSGMDLILGILKGIADHIEEIVTKGADIVIGFLKGVTKKLPEVIDAAFKLIISFINGLADAIRNNDDLILNACSNLMDAIIGALGKLLYKLNEVGKNIIQGIIDGVKAKNEEAKTAVVNLITDVINKIKNFLGIASPSTLFSDIGVNMINGLIEGIKSMGKKVVDAAIALFTGLSKGVKDLLGIKSPSTEWADIGMNLDKGLAVGLKKYSSLVGDQATDVGTTAVSSLSNAVSRIGDAITGDMDMTPTIRPVLDLTNITTGSKLIDSLLGNKGISVGGTSNQATAASQVANAGMNAQLSRDMKNALSDLKGAFKDAFNTLTVAQPQVNFNGNYSFSGKEDIDYFMNQAALLVQRRKS